MREENEKKRSWQQEMFVQIKFTSLAAPFSFLGSPIIECLNVIAL